MLETKLLPTIQSTATLADTLAQLIKYKKTLNKSSGIIEYTLTNTTKSQPVLHEPKTHPLYPYTKSTAQLIAEEPTCLREVEMGLMPSVRYTNHSYALFPNNNPIPLTNHLAGWYWLEHNLTDYDTYPAFSHKRERLQAFADHTFYAMADFLADYLMAACLAEVRHLGAILNEQVKSCKICNNRAWLAKTQNRYPAVCTLWEDTKETKFTSRYDCLTWLIHAFCDHSWLAQPDTAGNYWGSCGGRKWGYVALIAKEFNEALYGGDKLRLLLAFDKLAYTEHCSRSVLESRFEWSKQLFTEGLQVILSKKSSGVKCCWKYLKACGYLDDLYTREYPIDDSWGCQHSNEKLDKTRNPQLIFCRSLVQGDRCKGCNEAVGYGLSCKRACLKCNTCKVSSKHLHSCDNCGEQYPDPDNPPEHCKNWCEVCEKCTFMDKHNCHFCIQFCNGGGPYHNYCKICETYSICNKIIPNIPAQYQLCLKCNNIKPTDLEAPPELVAAALAKYATAKVEQVAALKVVAKAYLKDSAVKATCTSKGCPSTPVYVCRNAGHNTYVKCKQVCEEHAIKYLVETVSYYAWDKHTYKRIKIIGVKSQQPPKSKKELNNGPLPVT